jgi:hypothetical protein
MGKQFGICGERKWALRKALFQAPWFTLSVIIPPMLRIYLSVI